MLHPRKRITRREIKEDALVTAYVKVQKFFRKHKRQLNIGVTIVVIVGIIGVFMVRSKKRAELTAAGRLGIAEQFYYASDYPRAIDELSQIVNMFSGTRAAGRAAFFLANSYFTSVDYANAEKYFRLYVDDYSRDDLFSASSLAGIAACLESEDQYAGAARMYEKAGDEFADSFDAPFYFQQSGRCYVLAGDIRKGKELYRRIIDIYPNSSIRQEVEFLFETL